MFDHKSQRCTWEFENDALLKCHVQVHVKVNKKASDGPCSLRIKVYEAISLHFASIFIKKNSYYHNFCSVVSLFSLQSLAYIPKNMKTG